MPVKQILVPIDGTETSASVLEAALKVTTDLSAHAEILHVRADAKNAVPLLGEGMSGAMIEEMITLAEKEAGSRSERAKAFFEEARNKFKLPVAESAPGPDGPSVSWTEEIGREEEVTARRGRLVDLVVVGRPTPETDVALRLTLNAAIRETGRPVLVVPPEMPATIGQRVAIAWNGSTEAARAVNGTLQLISRAKEVFVLTVEADGSFAGIAGELADYLAWHGVKATPRAFPLAERGGGEEVLNQCKEVGADLLIMGAYTQNRVRRLILGGVTGVVLTAATLPVIMAR